MLSDFGIAILTEGYYQSLQDMAGTAPYMAPEQIKGQPRRASDQYALGIVVYEWLSGNRPFKGSFAEIVSQHMFVLPRPLHGRVPGISSALEQVVLKALAKDPQQRFADVQDFANALEQVALKSQAEMEHFLIQVGPPESKTTMERTVEKAISLQQAQYTEKKNGKSLLPQDFESETELAQQIVLDRPRYWEYLLIAELLKSKLTPIKQTLNDLQKGLVYSKKATPIRGNEFLGWARYKCKDFASLTVIAIKVCNEDIPKSWGPPGVVGEPLEIKKAIDKLIFTCNKMLDWEIGVRNAIIPKQLEYLKHMMEGWSFQIIDEIDSLSDKIVEPLKQPNPKVPINIHLTFNVSANTTEFLAEVQRLQKDLKLASILLKE